MDSLSLTEIAEYNDRGAFARVRNASASTASTFLESVQNGDSYSKLRSENIESSYSILNGISDRLEMVRANLTTMLGYAESGAAATTDSDRDEYIGLIRSLSGGIDDIVDNTVWDGEQLLNGRTIDLSLTASGTGTSEKLELDSYYSSDEDGFDLTSQPASGLGTIYYDYYAMFRNSEAGVVGLDLTAATASEVASTQTELDSGKYRLEIEYAGPDSKVRIKDSEGTFINEIDEVDLSGTGQEIVDLEVGISITIDKEQYLQSVDKYDYENEGSATLYAMMYYEQTFQHEIKQDNFEEFSDQGVTVNFQRDIDDGNGNELGFESFRISGVDEDQIGLESGNYNISVNYNGSSSSVEVKDSDGKLAYLNYRVDLSGGEPVNIDTGRGLSFSVDPGEYDGSGSISASVSYEADGNNNEDFDFVSYANKIQDAIDRLDADMEKVYDASDRVYTMYQYQSGNYGTSGNTVAGGQALSLITGSVSSDASNIFGAANGLLSTSAAEIFTNTASSISAQSNITYAKHLA